MPEITFERLKMIVADMTLNEALLKDEIARKDAQLAQKDAIIANLRASAEDKTEKSTEPVLVPSLLE